MTSPQLLTGWLQKQGHFVRNWKKRFFVLEMGRLQYFEKKSPKEGPPYGVNSKGCILMTHIELQEPDVDEANSEDANKIYLMDTESGKDLLVAASDYKECQIWKETLQAHIRFARFNPDLVLQPGDDYADDESRRLSAQRMSAESLPIRSISKAWNAEELVHASGAANAALMEASRKSPPSGAGAGGGGGTATTFIIQPVPGFVIKTRRESGMKVFINVCEHEKVPQSDKKRGNKKWPIFVLGAAFRRSVDKHAEECNVLDVCVHPTVITDCVNDKSGDTREEVCVKIIDALRTREKDAFGDTVEGGALDNTFSLPRLSKRYKGDLVVDMCVPASMEADRKLQHIFDAVDGVPARGGSDSEVALAASGRTLSNGEVSPAAATIEPTRKGSVFGALSRSKPPNRFKSIVESTMPSRPNGSDMAVPLIRRHIAFKVERQVGAMVRQRPDKTSARVKTLLQGTKVFVYGKRVVVDGSAWYRLLDGWTAAHTDGGQRTLRPVSDAQPLDAKVRGLRFVEVKGAGWFGSKGHRTMMMLEFAFPRDTILRLQRSVDDIATLKSDLKAWASDLVDPSLKARLKEVLAEKPCPTDSISDGQSLVENVDSLLALSDGVDQWLSAVVQAFDAQECTPLSTFLIPTEGDCMSMESDLTAPQGLDGAWGNYE